MSLQKFADLIGISKAHLWELESGKSANPSTNVLKKIAEECDVTIGWLVGEDRNEASDEAVRANAMFRELRSLNSRDQEVIRALIRNMSSSSKND